MLKKLKWDTLDYIHRNYLIPLGMVVSFVFALISAKSGSFMASLFTDLSAGLAFILFAAGLVSALNTSYRWLTRKSHLLELATPLPAWMILLSKIVLAAVVNLAACLFILQLSVIWGNSGRLILLNIQNLKGVPGMVLLLLMIDCTVMFAYIVTMSFKRLRKSPALSTSILAAILLIGIITFCALYMSARGTLILPSISTQNVLSVSGSLLVFSIVFPTLFALATILLELLGSSILLGKSFEKDETY